MSTITGYGNSTQTASLTNQPPERAHFDALSDKISEVVKGFEENLARLRRQTDRLGGSEPAGDASKSSPQAVANGMVEQLKDQVRYLENISILMHTELTRLERL